MQQFLATKQIRWNNILAKAPWFGAIYERLMKTVKRCLTLSGWGGGGNPPPPLRFFLNNSKTSGDIEKKLSDFNFREVSFFTGRGAPENWGDQVFFLRSKGGSKDFSKKKGGITYIL